MRKGILIITVLAAWFLLRNQEYMQLITGDKTTLHEKAVVFAKTMKKDLFQFTTVHLPGMKIKTNNSKHKTQSCLLQTTDDKHLHNHEPLLIVNGL